MQLPEPGHSSAVSDGTRCAARMQPSRNDVCLRRKRIEIEGPQREFLDDFFDGALEIEKVEGLRVVRWPAGKNAGSAEGERYPLFHSLSGTAEDCSFFKQLHIAEIAIEIVGQPGQHAWY